MKSVVLSTITAAVALGAALFGFQSTASAETKLTLVYPFPDFLVYTKNCKALVGKINEKGKGTVQIEILPFNSIKMFQQAPAVSKGRVDLVCTPAAFYARAIPENEAISTASSSVAQARKAGGITILDKLHQKHMKVKYLGWTTDGNKFRIYMKNPILKLYRVDMFVISGHGVLRSNVYFGDFRCELVMICCVRSFVVNCV